MRNVTCNQTLYKQKLERLETQKHLLIFLNRQARLNFSLPEKQARNLELHGGQVEENTCKGLLKSKFDCECTSSNY